MIWFEAWIGSMLSALGLTGMPTHYLWTVEVTLYVFWVLNKVVFMLISSSFH